MTQLTKNPAPTQILAVGAIIGTVIMWASAFVLARGIAPELSPLPLALLRLLAGVVVLTGLLALSRRASLFLPNRRALLFATGYGILWFALYTVAFNWAHHFADAGTVSLIVNVNPLLVAIGAGLFFNERISRRLLTGMAISLMGIGLITAAGGTEALAASGILLALLAAFLFAGGTLVQKLALRETSPLTATWLGCVAGTVSLLPFLGQTIQEVSVASSTTLIAALYLGVGPTALAFWFWGYAMTRFPAGRVASFALTVPAIVVVMSALFLHELPPSLAIIGGAISLLGVGVAQWKSRRYPRNEIR
ncbi:DMT family transporter [Nesterenkonia haasae]|uniref:DMT family transporter n=1 Tax=Nesterenkonia haasae TaxID=2587813 RepID=UPI001390DA0D|nr:DMT family transporter [Nesterenkonia haasae]NDK32437.1 DMT family transporter [Nesterenkonia haasae]